MRWGQDNNWDINMWRHFIYFWRPQKNADHQCVGQLYLDIYLKDKKSTYISDTKEIFDRFIDERVIKKNEWWWCDAIFMAAPVLARLYTVTQEDKYLQIMNSMFWETTDRLYSESDSLFYRDKSYLDARSKNGEKVFWSRGNAWVLAGIARILGELPTSFEGREHYVTLYKEISEKVKSLQHKDGFWKPSLLDQETYSNGESSGTALFSFALAWGINNGIHSREDYIEVLEKAQQALMKSVDSDGKIGWIQRPGSGPGEVKNEDSYMYGVGAFLLAGVELNKLLTTD